MNKFIFFADSHIRLTSTKRRKDNMFESQLAKLAWIGEKAREIDAQFIVSLGDIGDIWDWKISMVNKVAEVLKSYTVPLYTIIGNHDCPGRNPYLWKDTGIGLLESIGCLEILGINKSTLFEPKETDSFILIPYHSDTPETESLLKGEPQGFDKKDKKLVALVHAPVGAETTRFCIGHKDITIPDFDMALFGDIHTGWDIYDSPTGCKIANPGSLTRLSKIDMEREPQIGIAYEDGTIEYLVVPHKSKEDCFNVEALEKEIADIGKGFLAAIAAKKLAGDIDPKSFVEKIGTASGFSEQSIKILKDEIQI